MKSDGLEAWEVAALRLEAALEGKATADLLADMAKGLSESDSLPPNWGKELCYLLAYDYIQTQIGAIELKVDPYSLWVQRQEARKVGALMIHFGLKAEVGKGADDLETAYKALAEHQRKRSQKPRNVEVGEIIETLARRDAPAKALWPSFVGELDAEGLLLGESTTELKVTYYRKGQPDSLLFKTFANRISEERNKKSR